MVNKEVSEFYDEFSSFQETIAYNERHFLMLDRLLELGLKNDSSVLELGCGIGVISSLICKVIKDGRLAAVDISPKNIEIARKNNNPKLTEFYVADAVEFEKNKISYDFITLFDVLEHIPIEVHVELFANVVSHMSSETVLVVNIPNPKYLQYLHDNSPEMLQIIDQPLELSEVLKVAEANNLRLRFFETYDLWQKDESQFMVFKKDRKYEVIETQPPKQTYLRQFQNKFEKYW